MLNNFGLIITLSLVIFFLDDLAGHFCCGLHGHLRRLLTKHFGQMSKTQDSAEQNQKHSIYKVMD